jgi:alcohol dehydrogenase class IV
MIDRITLQESFVDRVVQDMDEEIIMAIVYDFVHAQCNEMENEQFFNEVKEFYPDLLIDTKPAVKLTLVK